MEFHRRAHVGDHVRRERELPGPGTDRDDRRNAVPVCAPSPHHERFASRCASASRVGDNIGGSVADPCAATVADGGTCPRDVQPRHELVGDREPLSLAAQAAAGGRGSCAESGLQGSCEISRDELRVDFGGRHKPRKSHAYGERIEAWLYARRHQGRARQRRHVPASTEVL